MMPKLSQYTMGKTAVSVLEFAAHKVPEFKEQASKDWILYGTDDEWKNRYPDYLLYIYDRSAKHYAIVNGKVDYIIGQGIAVNDRGLNTEQVAKLNKFVEEPNPDQNLNEILAQCALDLEIFGGFALEVLYDKKGVALFYHAEFGKYRASKDGKKYYHCTDWKKAKPDTITTIDAFDWSNPKGKQLLYIKAYHPKADYYPLPPYLGAIPYIELDSEIANFHLNSVKNGFMAGTVFSFNNGQPTEEEQEVIEEKIEAKFSGTDNANKILLLFNDSKEQGVEVVPMSSNGFEDRFDILNNTVQEEIFSGHRVVDPALFGIKQEGIFAGRTQIRDSYELFKNTYVRARQAFLMDIFNELAALNGFEKRLSIIDSEPISEGFSEQTKVSVMTTEEIRQAVGLPPLEAAQIAKELKLAAEDGEAENRITEAFGATGLLLTEWEVVKPLRSVNFSNETEWMAFENNVNKYGFESDPFLMGILNAIQENPTVTYAAIAELLGTSLDQIAQGVIELVRQGLLGIGTETVAGASQIAYTISDAGLSQLATAQPLGVKFKIAYRYVVSQEAAADPDPSKRAPIISTTREFCRRMVRESASRVWTSEQIQQLAMGQDRNVWMRRGGFWTRTGGRITTSYCRHAWESVIVKSIA